MKSSVTKRRRFASTVLLGLASSCLGGLAAAAPLPPVVAAFDIEDTAGLAPEAVEQLSTYYTARLAEGRVFTLIPRAQVKAALDHQKAASMKACVDEACHIELGRELAASRVLKTQVVRLTEEECAVNATLFDLRTAVSEVVAVEKSACEQHALVASLERLAGSLKARTALAVATALQNLGELVDALEAVNRAIDAKPDLAELYVRRASLRTNLAASPAVLARLDAPDPQIPYAEIKAALLLAAADLERYLRLAPQAHDHDVVESQVAKLRGHVRSAERGEAALGEARRQQESKKQQEAARLAERAKQADSAERLYKTELAAARAKRTRGWLYSGAGVLLGAGAVVFGALGSGVNDQISQGHIATEAELSDAAARGRLYNGLGITATALGAVAIIVGSAIILSNLDPDRAEVTP